MERSLDGADVKVLILRAVQLLVKSKTFNRCLNEKSIGESAVLRSNSLFGLCSRGSEELFKDGISPRNDSSTGSGRMPRRSNGIIPHAAESAS